MRTHLLVGFTVLAASSGFGCQSYPFELRNTVKSLGHKVTQQVINNTPTDILFVIDNSGSMATARAELAANMGSFIATIVQNNTDFHLAVVTTDVDCNVPERSCDAGGTPGTTSQFCCRLAGGDPLCRDVADPNGTIVYSNCDGGRMRAPAQGKPAYWTAKVGDANTAVWQAEVAALINQLGCKGSSLESGLEAARRAVDCATNEQGPLCPSKAAADLNRGFVRDDADLVVLFLTDEDDCSFTDPTAYARPPDPSRAADRAAHLCSPEECYAYYAPDSNNDGILDWADPSTSDPNTTTFRCSGPTESQNPNFLRHENPPLPDPVARFVDALVTAKKGDVGRVRAAGIIGGVPSVDNPLGLTIDACVGALGAVTNGCGCWTGQSSGSYCALTQLLGHRAGRAPAPDPNQLNCDGQPGSLAGCRGMPGGRYSQFLTQLAERRMQAGAPYDTLAGSICQERYDETLNAVVNTIVLGKCFALGTIPSRAEEIRMVVTHRDGAREVVPQATATAPGWTWAPGSERVCLKNLPKTLGDTFDLYFLDASQ